MTNEVYFRPAQKYPYNLTEDQVREAFTIYNKITLAKIIAEIQEDYPIDITEDESILEVIVRAAEAGITEGMKISVDHMDVIHYYLDQQKAKDNPIFQVLQYEFEEGKGISGVLKPSGDFIKCGNAEHYIVAEHIDFEEQKECVYFSGFLDTGSCIMTLSPFGDRIMTNAQIWWIDVNLKYLDKQQKEMYELLKEELYQ
jgi:hypothetical protein